MDLVDTIYEAMVVEGGLTISPNGTDVPTTGFMVAVPGQQAVVHTLLTKGHIAKWLEESALTDMDFIGGWFDPNTGNYYLDLSEHIADYDEAVSVGKDRKQIAIWDIANGTEIYL